MYVQLTEEILTPTNSAKGQSCVRAEAEMIITIISEHGFSSTTIRFYRAKELMSPGKDCWHLGKVHIFLYVFLDAAKDLAEASNP